MLKNPRPAHLLTAAGSSKAGAALVKCMEGQKAASQ